MRSISRQKATISSAMLEAALFSFFFLLSSGSKILVLSAFWSTSSGPFLRSTLDILAGRGSVPVISTWSNWLRSSTWATRLMATSSSATVSTISGSSGCLARIAIECSQSDLNLSRSGFCSSARRSWPNAALSLPLSSLRDSLSRLASYCSSRVSVGYSARALRIRSAAACEFPAATSARASVSV